MDKIAQILNLPIVPDPVKDIVQVPAQKNPEEQAKDDFDTARNSMLTALETSQTALEQLSQIAVGSQHPRAFEVLAKLVDTIGETSKGLVDLHKQKQTKQTENTTINNKLVISTTDLLKMLKNKDEIK
jgi:Xaa-Pro aminopeptidase